MKWQLKSHMIRSVAGMNPTMIGVLLTQFEMKLKVVSTPSRDSQHLRRKEGVDVSEGETCFPSQERRNERRRSGQGFVFTRLQRAENRQPTIIEQ